MPAGSRWAMTSAMEFDEHPIAAIARAQIVDPARAAVLGRERLDPLPVGAADRAHYRADIVMNVALVVALLLTKLTGWQPFYSPFVIGIALYMGGSAWRIARPALDMVLDRELPAMKPLADESNNHH
jgi:hypothetical protein